MPDYLAIHSVRLATTLTQVHQLKPHTILEIGCYPAEALLLPLRQKYHVSGICSPFDTVTLPDVATLNIETDPFPYPANSFDLVLLCEVIEHLPIFPPQHLLDQLTRVIKPGGYLLITTPNKFQLKNLVRHLLPLKPPAGEGHAYTAHHHEYGQAELTSLIAKSGFTIVRSQLVDFYTPFRSKSRLESPLVRLVKILLFGLTSAVPGLRDSQLLLARRLP